MDLGLIRKALGGMPGGSCLSFVPWKDGRWYPVKSGRGGACHPGKLGEDGRWRPLDEDELAAVSHHHCFLSFSLNISLVVL
jgi:hypothetical protein